MGKMPCNNNSSRLIVSRLRSTNLSTKKVSWACATGAPVFYISFLFLFFFVLFFFYIQQYFHLIWLCCRRRTGRHIRYQRHEMTLFRFVKSMHLKSFTPCLFCVRFLWCVLKHGNVCKAMFMIIA